MPHAGRTRADLCDREAEPSRAPGVRRARYAPGVQAAPFEEAIDGVVVRVDVAPMLAWAEGAWLEDVALAALVVVIALALALRLRTPEHRWLAWVPAILATLAGVFALSEVGRATAGSGEGVFELFPELADRYAAMGVRALAAALGAAGAALGLAVDLPAWRAARMRHGAVLALTLLPLALGALGWSRSAEARDHARTVGAIGPLPRASFEPVALHVDQSRTVPATQITELGVRTGRAVMFIFASVTLVADAGSPEDLARLEAHEAFRREMATEDLAAWSRAEVALEAPHEPGPFTVSLTIRQGPVELVTEIDAEAISDAGDPLFPLAVGTERTFEHLARRSRGAPVVDGPPLVIRVVREAVVDGFRTLDVLIDDGGEPTTTRVVPWAGRYRTAPAATGPLFLTEVESTALGEHEGTACALSPQPTLVCDCRGAALDVPPGPVACVRVISHAGSDLLALGLGMVTGGITMIAGVMPTGSTFVDYRLVSADGVGVGERE